MRRSRPTRAGARATPTSASSRAAALPPLLPFAQLDLPGRLGPGDGRYLLRSDGEPDADPDVLVVTTLAAPRAAGPRLRRSRAQDVAGDPEPPPLPLTRITVIRPRPFGDGAAAERWLERVCGDRDLAAALAAEAIARLNRALHAHRTAAGDPTVADVDASRAVAIRFGFGTGDEVADGRWRHAKELPERQRRGLLQRDYEAMRPQERVAAVLGGRERVGPHEELIVRARGDVDAGRLATAALGLHAALEALEPTREGSGATDEQLATMLRDASATAAEARRAVLAGALDEDLDAQALDEAVRAAETLLRRRALS